MIKIRAFKPVDELDTCKRYLDGHRKVLEEFNLSNISTNTPRWIHHKNTYCVIAEMDGELLGGIRVQVADGDFSLPVEDAVGHYDRKILELVNTYMADSGVCELCGLWNSRKLAPNMGITMLLSTAGVAIADQLEIKNMFAICATYTLRSAMRIGFSIETSVGRNGEFVYPNSNFVARVLKMNCLTLEKTIPLYKEEILSLRKNPSLIVKGNEEEGVLDLEYNLSLVLKPSNTIASEI